MTSVNYCVNQLFNLQLPNNVITTITKDISVGTILLPEDGELILQPSVTIRLSEDQECEGEQ